MTSYEREQIEEMREDIKQVVKYIESGLYETAIISLSEIATRKIMIAI